MITMLVISALAQAAVQPAPQPAEKADRTICRREAPIGSHVPGRRVCKKSSEWAARSTKVDMEGRVTPQWQGGTGSVGNRSN